MRTSDEDPGHPSRWGHRHRLGRTDRADRLVRGGDRARLHGQPLPEGRLARVARRVGPRRSLLRHLGDLVPAGRRPLHGLHLHRGAGGDVRDRRRRGLLRGALHDHPVPDHLHLHGAAVVGQPPPRLRHDGRLRPRPLRLAGALAGGRGHRLRRDDALHRAAARRHPGRARGGRARRQRQLAGQGPAAADRVRAAGGVHLHLGSARPGGDRLRQGRPDLPGHHRRGDLPADHDRRRLVRGLRRREGEDGDHQRGDRKADGIVHPRHRPDVGLRDAGPGFGDGAVHVSRTR